MTQTTYFVLDFVINGVLFWICIALLILQAYNVLFHRGIPNIRTAPALRKKMIELIKEPYLAREKGAPFQILDLGAGHGLLSRSLALAFPEAFVIGAEIAIFSILWARFFARRAGCKNLRYVQKDLFDLDFSQADVIVFYLIPPLMERLGEKLHREAKSGALILSNKFLLGDGWQPEATFSLQTRYLHQKEIHLYRKA